MTLFPFIHSPLKLEYILEVNRFLNRDNYKLEKNEINIKKKNHPARFLIILISPR